MAALVIVPSLLVMVLGGWWLRYEVHASLLGSMSRTLEEKSERINARLAQLPDGKVQEAVAKDPAFAKVMAEAMTVAELRGRNIAVGVDL